MFWHKSGNWIANHAYIDREYFIDLGGFRTMGEAFGEK